MSNIAGSSIDWAFEGNTYKVKPLTVFQWEEFGNWAKTEHVRFVEKMVTELRLSREAAMDYRRNAMLTVAEMTRTDVMRAMFESIDGIHRWMVYAGVSIEDATALLAGPDGKPSADRAMVVSDSFLDAFKVAAEDGDQPKN